MAPGVAGVTVGMGPGVGVPDASVGTGVGAADSCVGTGVACGAYALAGNALVAAQGPGSLSGLSVGVARAGQYSTAPFFLVHPTQSLFGYRPVSLVTKLGAIRVQAQI